MQNLETVTGSDFIGTNKKMNIQSFLQKVIILAQFKILRSSIIPFKTMSYSLKNVLKLH